jgi:hypothetical protein
MTSVKQQQVLWSCCQARYRQLVSGMGRPHHFVRLESSSQNCLPLMKGRTSLSGCSAANWVDLSVPSVAFRSCASLLEERAAPDSHKSLTRFWSCLRAKESHIVLLVTATAGAAAAGINGITIHSACNFPKDISRSVSRSSSDGLALPTSTGLRVDGQVSSCCRRSTTAGTLGPGPARYM